MDYKKLTRREALKYLGTTVAGMTLVSTGTLSMFTFCTEKEKNRVFEADEIGIVRRKQSY